MTFTSVNQFTSSLLVTVMGGDRYFIVCHPILAQRLRTPRLAKIACFTVWLIGAILMTPAIIYAGTGKDGKTCGIFWPE